VIKFSDLAESEDVCCGDVICCLFGLSSTDANILSIVKKRMTVAAVMKLTKKSQPRVQISLNKLVSIGLLSREETKSERGIKYVYRPVKKEQLKKILHKQLKESTKRLKSEIDAI
jgi:predicted transcriptional regulator